MPISLLPNKNEKQWIKCDFANRMAILLCNRDCFGNDTICYYFICNDRKEKKVKNLSIDQQRIS